MLYQSPLEMMGRSPNGDHATRLGALCVSVSFLRCLGVGAIAMRMGQNATSQAKQLDNRIGYPGYWDSFKNTAGHKL